MFDSDHSLLKQFSKNEILNKQIFDLKIQLFKLKLDNVKLKFALKCAERDFNFKSTKYID